VVAGVDDGHRAVELVRDQDDALDTHGLGLHQPHEGFEVGPGRVEALVGRHDDVDVVLGHGFPPSEKLTSDSR
jgi:hypothetical protein